MHTSLSISLALRARQATRGFAPSPRAGRSRAKAIAAPNYCRSARPRAPPRPAAPGGGAWPGRGSKSPAAGLAAAPGRRRPAIHAAALIERLGVDSSGPPRLANFLPMTCARRADRGRLGRPRGFQPAEALTPWRRSGRRSRGAKFRPGAGESVRVRSSREAPGARRLAAAAGAASRTHCQLGRSSSRPREEEVNGGEGVEIGRGAKVA